MTELKRLTVKGKATIYSVLYGAGVVQTIEGASLYQDGSAVKTTIDAISVETTWWPAGSFFWSKEEAAEVLRRHLIREITNTGVRARRLRECLRLLAVNPPKAKKGAKCST